MRNFHARVYVTTQMFVKFQPKMPPQQWCTSEVEVQILMLYYKKRVQGLCLIECRSIIQHLNRESDTDHETEALLVCNVLFR